MRIPTPKWLKPVFRYQLRYIDDFTIRAFLISLMPFAVLLGILRLLIGEVASSWRTAAPVLTAVRAIGAFAITSLFLYLLGLLVLRLRHPGIFDE